MNINLEITGYVNPLASSSDEFRFRVIPIKGGIYYGDTEIIAINPQLVTWVYEDMGFLEQPHLSFSTLSLPRAPKIIYFQVKHLEYQQPFIHKEEMGHCIEMGYLKIEGTLLESKPDEFMTFDKFIKEIRDVEPTVIDHTRGKGTLYEQIARSDGGSCDNN